MMEALTTAALDVRSDFPIFARPLRGRRLVYLDTAATAQKPTAVLQAMDAYYREANANTHRGVYSLAQDSDARFEGARARIAQFVGARHETTVFTRNATEAINLVAWSWGRTNVRRGDVVLITEMEHHSNLVPWQVLCQAVGAELRYLEVGEDGQLSLDQLDAELGSGRVRLAAFVHVSNVLGTINPVAEMVARVRAAGATSLVDGSQAVPQLPVDLPSIDPDFYVWTGHKALGPTGVGVLHGRRELLEAMPPFLTGGAMISWVGRTEARWNELPWKFEAGTSPIAEVVGLGAAVDYLEGLGMDRVRAHERELTRTALAGVAELEGVRALGPASAEERGGVLAFVVDGMHPHDVAELLDREGVCVRAGHHCTQPLMRKLGLPATARASFGPYNGLDDVEAFLGALRRAREVFGL